MAYINLETRQIALIGIGTVCKHFYMQFQGMLDIKYCFSVGANKKSSNMESFFAGSGVKYEPFEASLVRKQNLLLVMCAGHEFRKRNDKILYNKGFQWGKDYIDSLYVVQYYRKKYDLRLENKNIWIFGAGNTGKRFYDKYREVYKIGGFISNFSTETACLGLPVIRPGEITRQDAPHVVICCNEEALIAEQLGKMGYRGGRDFTFEDMLPKRLLIAVGTCQIERVTKLLQKNIKSVTYDICIYRDNMYAPCSEADNRRLEAYGAYCDVVFYNVVNAGTSEHRNYEPLVTQYFPESKRLFMPFYYFSGQAVQASEVENKYTIMYRNQYFWLRGDKEINNMIENGLTMEEVRRQVANPDYWDREKIRKHFYRELKKIEIMDRFSSFPIKGFIEKNYRDMMIFNDDTHFGFHLSMYLANALAETLDIEPITDPGLLEEAEREERSVMPLYPSVRQALEMNIKGDARIYNVKEGKTVNVDIEMYAEIYYRYVVSIRDIYKGLGTIF